MIHGLVQVLKDWLYWWKRLITLYKAGNSAQGEDVGMHEARCGLYVQTFLLKELLSIAQGAQGSKSLESLEEITPPSF